ncbi:hypothetical protein MAA5396_04451 [Marinovum algicola]|uniref:Uncharacterized protein n=1 Tax=Marinovum algicola TaxID=42444 RepID=A0A975WE52_9RHOB|nr:hypothetical protein SAMN04487940_12176 [Marinovum algicola]SLN75326.1 hypothetical protein MAA5396_04451 [Marinovum algicola]
MPAKTIRQFANFFHNGGSRIDLSKARSFEAGAIIDAIQREKTVQPDEVLPHPPCETGCRKDCLDQAGGAPDGGLAAQEAGGTDQRFDMASKKAFQSGFRLESGAGLSRNVKCH